jgi:hypothetical protein
MAVRLFPRGKRAHFAMRRKRKERKNMKKAMQTTMKKGLAMLMALALVFTLLPVGALAFPSSTVSVRIIGEDSVILNVPVSVADVIDYTTDAADSSTGLNALDAVIYATRQNSYGADSYTISYNSSWYSYYLSELVSITPAGSDYWGTLAISSGGVYDGNALSSHALAAGDTYTVYYDKYTGRSENYGNQSYAWFTAETASGTTGSAIAVEVKATGYDTSYNTVASALAGATVYATGGDYTSPTAVGITDEDGKAYIVFGKAGTYALTLDSYNYTFTTCTVTVSGSDVSLNQVYILTNPVNTEVLLSKDSAPYSPYYAAGGSWAYWLPGAVYDYSATADGYFPASGTVDASGGAVTKNVALTAPSGSLVTITTGNVSETVVVANASGTAQTSTVHASGVWSYDLTDGDYTYTVSRSGYHSTFDSFIVDGAAVSLTPAALTDTAGAGPDDICSLRGTETNMATGSWSIPKGSWQTTETWATSLGALGSWGTLSTSNILKYDGYLYVATEHGLAKLDASDGTLLKTTALGAETGYVLYIAYGDGKIFVTTKVGIDAFDALTMERLWTYQICSGCHYMAATPILFDSESSTVYVGDYGDDVWGTIGTYGGYSAINADTGANIWTMWGGATDALYSAGAVIAGNYIVFGSDSGTLTSVAASSATATAAGTLSLNGQIRSSVAYDGTYLYVTTKAGGIYKISIDSAGALAVVSFRQFTAGSSTSTPVVYDGRVYVGASDGIYVFNASNFSQVEKITTSAAVSSSALLTNAYSGTDGAVYVYFTVNSPRGEIIVLKDTGTAVTYETLYIPSHAQYCLNSLVAGGDGTLYYSNDSGYVMALSNSGSSNANKAQVVFSVNPSSVFDSNTYATAYPTITLYGNQIVVPTVSSGTYYLPAGTYSYTVSLTGYYSSSGTFDISASDLGSKTVSVALNPIATGTDTDMSISFLLKGFPSEPSTVLTLEKGCTIADVISAASSELGFTATGLSSGFITAVTYNGVTRSNESEGAESGWLYQVGTDYPVIGISSYYLNSDASVTLRYSLDYTADVPWEGTQKQDEQISLTLSGGTLEVAAEQDGNNLSLTLEDDDVDALIQGKDTAGRVNIDVSSVSGVDDVTLNKTAFSAIANAASGGTVTGATVKTGRASVTLSAAALQNIAKQAGGEEISIRAAEASQTGLSAAQKETIGNNPVFELAMHSDGTPITQFEADVTVSIPYTPTADQLSEGFKVFYIDADGKAQEVTGAYYDAATGSIVFTTTHFSLYMIGYRPFADVGSGDWFYEAAYHCADNGLFNGTSQTAFSPDVTMTREMFVTVLYRLAGEPEVSGTADFTDAAAISAWALDAVLWASGNEIVSGYPDGSFQPQGEISREQMALILYHYATIAGYDVSGTASAGLDAFRDGTDTGLWAVTALRWAVNAGLVNGNGDGTVKPQGEASRAQVAQILYNFTDWIA